MIRFGLLLAGALLGLTTLSAVSLTAQQGQCRDAWVTQAVREVTGRAPNGSGDSGECNFRNYGGGQWSSYPDLVNKVRAHFASTTPTPAAAPQGQCRDPWVAQAVREVTGRAPNGTGDSGECNFRNYGGGQWSSYPDLVAKVRTHFASAPIGGDAPANAPASASARVGQVGYQYSGVTEYCFGAVGPKCDGAPNAGVTRNADGTVTMKVSVGSILHDNCCLKYPPTQGDPGGKFCNGPISEFSHNGQCVLEWDKAFWNTIHDGRQWDATFNPNQRAELIVTQARVSRFQDRLLNQSGRQYQGFETTDTRKLSAKAGTALDVGDEAFCASGRAVRKNWLAKEWIECQ
jgi:hypothetical protein